MRDTKRDRERAHSAVSRAKRRGDLPALSTLRCHDCGKPAECYHHYLGYAPEYRLHVQALCHSCHLKRTYVEYAPRKRGRRKDMALRKRVERLLIAGMLPPEIAVRLGISRQRVGQLVQELGFKRAYRRNGKEAS